MQTSNSSNNKTNRKSKHWKRISSVLVFVIYLSASLAMLGYCMEPVTFSLYYNHDLREISKQNRSVDMVFVGASRTYRSFIPSTFEEELGFDCVINGGSSLQPMSGSYYQLKDLIERYHPKYAVLGVTWEGLLKTQDDTLLSRLIVCDRLKLSNKIQYGIEGFTEEEKLYFLRAYRYRNELDELYGFQNVIQKFELIQNHYTPNKSNRIYFADSGFVYSNQVLQNGNVRVLGGGTFSRENIDEREVAYLEKIVELCEKEGVKLHMVTGPTTLMRMYKVKNYQDATDYYAEFAKEHGIIYHNLNFLKNREEFLPDSKMQDANHVNGKGAQIISDKYAKILKADMKGEDTSAYFYPNFEEFKKDIHRVVAVEASIARSKDTLRFFMNSLQSEGVVPYYKAEISIDEGKTYKVLVPWTKEARFEKDISVSGPYQIRVWAKTGYANEIKAYQVYKFKS